MNANLGKTEFTPSEIDDLRGRLKALKAAQEASWTNVAGWVGVPSGTISAWTEGTYNGGKYYDNQTVPAAVYRFFLASEEKAALQAVMPADPDFQMTTSADRMLKVMAVAQLGDMGLISTPPGCGKSAAIKQYQATRPLVFVATMKPSTRGVNTMLLSILAAMNDRVTKGTPQALSERVIERVRQVNGALLVVDEAQHLSPQALDELRAIHDCTEVGVLLSGDENLLVALRKYPQLFSRLGVRHTQNKPLLEDVSAVAAGWGIAKGAELAFLQEIGRKSGGLRAVAKTIKLAKRAAQADGTPVSVGDLRDAYGQRYGEAA
ncbi:MAG: hypothetical protein JWP35_3507 [Caulobacter sp.]|nr:hypothetical protein [Caulobacter sp.]